MPIEFLATAATCPTVAASESSIPSATCSILRFTSEFPIENTLSSPDKTTDPLPIATELAPSTLASSPNARECAPIALADVVGEDNSSEEFTFK